MSAKGRGRHDGGDVDFYPTPAWAVHRLLDDCGPSLLWVDRAIEPSCGDGAIVRAVDSWSHANGVQLVDWTGVELRRDAVSPDTRLASLVEGDLLRWDWFGGQEYGLALGNPPFSLAEQFIARCLNHCGVVAMLLRVSFLGSDERVPFFRGIGANPALRVLPDRPSFDGIGQDSSTYAWFVWGSSTVQGVKMLDSTPLAIRKAQTPQGLVFEASQRSLF